MGDELSEIVKLEDGSIIKGYRVLNRNISPFYNCDAGGFYSLEEGGFVGENVTVDGFNLNGDLVLKGAYIAPNAKGIIIGFGLMSYELALQSFLVS